MSTSKPILKKKKTKSQIICQNLNLTHQTIFQDYKCTLIHHNNSYFGRLYIGEQNVLFVSNMFGFVKKYVILIDNISNLTEQADKKITMVETIPDKTKDEEYCFTGFKNNNAFRIIKALWKREKLQSDIISSNQEEEPEELENIKNQSYQNLNQKNVEISYFNPEIVDNQKQKMIEIILPCSVQQFYRFFLADNAELYPRKKHLQLKKAKNISTTPWKQNQQLNAQTRQLFALMRIKGVPLLSQARMNQIHIITKNTKQQINMKLITNMDDVPYHSYFNCQEIIDVVKQGENKCKFSIKVVVVFHKSTYLKNTILGRAFGDFKEDYKMWSDNVKEIFEKMQKEQQQAGILRRRSSQKFKQSKLQYQSNKTNYSILKPHQDQKQPSQITINQQKQTQATKQQILKLKADLLQMKTKLNTVTIILIILIVINMLHFTMTIF